ncbi:putative CBS domain protein [Candidatus Nitrososphaera gargensis Ga9.2]|uniref:Putative CBS domain protein n=1 Tax=Nitrososphaera gargensis (strain Ga9.2) TaxID=1237085 RepID=K0IIT0_NITGG|nr:CBS domain-containing protein [Candidatus Nitrososphaera gargensis]AFU58983.1 putative CBS domain protein [Candidatus Nitrososphaera gargensis Ga9.2]
MSAVSEIVSPRKIVALRVDRTPSALDAAKLMVKNKVGSVVVVDFEEKPVGIVTERDILKKVTALNKSPREIAVQDIMSFPVITIKTYDSIETAAAVMAKNKIKRLVVLEQDGSLVGVLSITDITRKLAKILANDYKRYGHFKAILDF